MEPKAEDSIILDALQGLINRHRTQFVDARVSLTALRRKLYAMADAIEAEIPEHVDKYKRGKSQ